MRRKWAVITTIMLVGSFVAAPGGSASASTTFTVNQTGDQNDLTPSDNVCDTNSLFKGYQCTLRAAIQQANATVGTDSIAFSIGSSGGAQTISPGSALPTITDAVTIDATTQPGSFGGPVITLSGLSAGKAHGLTLAASGSTVIGLIIDSFTGDGISIIAGGGDTIWANWIGIDASGADKGNARDGIYVGGSGADSIGGASISGAYGNVISGNDANGVEILSGSVGDTVAGNVIGANRSVNAGVGNSLRGVVVHQGSATIGGNSVGGNIIAGNGLDGVLIEGGAATNVSVRSNVIGTNGDVAIPNGGAGVAIIDAPGNLVVGNTVSGNTGAGVWVTESSPGLAPSNVITRNSIGTQGTNTAIPNASGVVVSASGTTVGGSGSGDGNFISANTGRGISVNAPGTQVLGNRIGVTTSNHALPNATGVDVTVGPNTIGGTTGTTPGGACTGACNVISGNSGDGVHLELGVSQVTVAGNMVGLDQAGSTSIPNGTGIEVQGSSNTVGGTAAGAGNVISGNSGTGVLIDGLPSNPLPTLNLVQGNRIGTTTGGTAALGNLQGVAIFDATTNTIGGTTGTSPGGACTGACNVISGNTNSGIEISNADTTGNIISGNFVGTDTTGTAIAGLGNGGNGGGPGIQVETSASGTVIGGTTTSARNIISGSSGEGIDLKGALKTKVQGNYIGTDTTGTIDLGNGEVLATKEPGITVFGGSATVIGGKGGARNLISGNGEAGVLVDGAAMSTKLPGNLIGTNANGSTALGNGGDGVEIANGFKSTIGGITAGLGNTIGFNAGAGVSVIVGTGNAIRQNSMRSNGGLGIDLDPAGVNPNDSKDPDPGPNLRQNYPVITSASSSGGSTVISGTFNSTENTAFTLEFFSSPACDAFGFGEGKRFLGRLGAVSTNLNGNATWTVTLPVTVPTGSVITATATDPSANTSEFSACRVST